MPSSPAPADIDWRALRCGAAARATGAARDEGEMSRRAAMMGRCDPSPREQGHAVREAADPAGAAAPTPSPGQQKARLLEIIKQKSLLKGRFTLVTLYTTRDLLG